MKTELIKKIGKLNFDSLQSKKEKFVAVVPLVGVLSNDPMGRNRNLLNYKTVAKKIIKAFDNENSIAVAFRINSPGGQPAQAEMIANLIRAKAEKTGKPVYAFCEDVAASGGYWIAVSADEVYALKTSIVGSIGVISSSFGAVDLTKKIGLERRLFTAGDNKSHLDPFSPLTKADETWIKDFQEQLHVQFKDWVKSRREGKISKSDKEIFNGDVWQGTSAVDLGLIDGLGTFSEVLVGKHPGVELRALKLKDNKLKNILNNISLDRITDTVVAQSMSTLDQAAEWSKYGL